MAEKDDTGQHQSNLKPKNVIKSIQHHAVKTLGREESSTDDFETQRNSSASSSDSHDDHNVDDDGHGVSSQDRVLEEVLGLAESKSKKSCGGCCCAKSSGSHRERNRKESRGRNSQKERRRNRAEVSDSQEAFLQAAAVIRRTSKQDGPVRLLNAATKEEAVDSLHLQAPQNFTRCASQACPGGLAGRVRRPTLESAERRTAQDILEQAKQFFTEYEQTSPKKVAAGYSEARIADAERELKTTGTFNLTPKELGYGAKLAWRNAPRCIGRIQWSKLQVFDARNINTAQGMFEALCRHLQYSTNWGKIRSAVTVFRQRIDGQGNGQDKGDFRIWNASLISYAGYKMPDGQIVGDPANLEFTEVCESLGWKGSRTQFDVLPLVLVCDGKDPEWFEIPAESVLTVKLRHPEYTWLKNMGMQWYAVPAVSSMALDIAGLDFTAAVFSGWYMQTEIASNLCDVNRYNFLPGIAENLGYDTKDTASLWRERALIEMNAAVIHSFRQDNVTLVDHQTAAESFLKHYEQEKATRGGCPADWAYIVPPLAASTTRVFHQEMLSYQLKPSFEYQFPGWQTHVWANKLRPSSEILEGIKVAGKKLRLNDVAKAIVAAKDEEVRSMASRTNATILYATSGGRSEKFAATLQQLLNRWFNVHLVRMDQYDVAEFPDESLVLAVVSTDFNGGPPKNGQDFARNLYLLDPGNATDGSPNQPLSHDAVIRNLDLRLGGETRPEQKIAPGSHDDFMGKGLKVLSNTRFAVFGLGSSAYPRFAAFGKYVDTMLELLGGDRLVRYTVGDEVTGQTHAFESWARNVIWNSKKAFALSGSADDGNNGMKSTKDKFGDEFAALRKPGMNAFFKSAPASEDLGSALTRMSGRRVGTMKLINREDLHEPEEYFSTVRVDFDPGTSNSIFELDAPRTWRPGDLVGIYPSNDAEVVARIESRLRGNPGTKPVWLFEKISESNMEHVSNCAKKGQDDARGARSRKVEHGFGICCMKQMVERPYMDYPAATVREFLTYYMDVTSPPEVEVLRVLADGCFDQLDVARITGLIQDSSAYREWRLEKNPTLADALDEFASSRPEAARLLYVLPPLKPRFYNISSAKDAQGGKIQLAVAGLKYRVKGGQIRRGLCSTFLRNVKVGALVPAFHKSNKDFHLPVGSISPLLLIGPGVGVAPFRAFWQQCFEDQQRELISTADTFSGSMTLYTGCRRRSCQLFREEIASMLTSGVLANVKVAVSREDSVPPMHVQDLLLHDSANILKFITKDKGMVYVSGDNQMSDGVYDTFADILVNEGRMGCDEAEHYLVTMKGEGRYKENVYEVSQHSMECYPAPSSRSLLTPVNAETPRVGRSLPADKPSEVNVSNQQQPPSIKQPSTKTASKVKSKDSVKKTVVESKSKDDFEMHRNLPQQGEESRVESKNQEVAKLKATVKQLVETEKTILNETSVMSPISTRSPIPPEVNAARQLHMDTENMNAVTMVEEHTLAPGTILETTDLISSASGVSPPSTYQADSKAGPNEVKPIVQNAVVKNVLIKETSSVELLNATDEKRMGERLSDDECSESQERGANDDHATGQSVTVTSTHVKVESSGGNKASDVERAQGVLVATRTGNTTLEPRVDQDVDILQQSSTTHTIGSSSGTDSSRRMLFSGTTPEATSTTNNDQERKSQSPLPDDFPDDQQLQGSSSFSVDTAQQYESRLTGVAKVASIIDAAVLKVSSSRDRVNPSSPTHPESIYKAAQTPSPQPISSSCSQRVKTSGTITPNLLPPDETTQVPHEQQMMSYVGDDDLVDPEMPPATEKFSTSSLPSAANEGQKPMSTKQAIHLIKSQVLQTQDIDLMKVSKVDAELVTSQTQRNRFASEKTDEVIIATADSSCKKKGSKVQISEHVKVEKEEVTKDRRHTYPPMSKTQKASRPVTKDQTTSALIFRSVSNKGPQLTHEGVGASHSISRQTPTHPKVPGEASDSRPASRHPLSTAARNSADRTSRLGISVLRPSSSSKKAQKAPEKRGRSGSRESCVARRRSGQKVSLEPGSSTNRTPRHIIVTSHFAQVSKSAGTHENETSIVHGHLEIAEEGQTSKDVTTLNQTTTTLEEEKKTVKTPEKELE